MTDESDPFFLFNLSLGEADFQGLVHAHIHISGIFVMVNLKYWHEQLKSVCYTTWVHVVPDLEWSH